MAKIFYWLLPFYLLSFVASTAGEEIFGAAIFLVFLIDVTLDISKSGFKSILQNLKIGADIPVLFFAFWALLATQIIFNNGKELWETFGDIRWILMLYGLSYLMKKYFSLKYEKHFKFILICTGLVGIYGIIQMFTRIDLIRPTNDHISKLGDYYRAIGFFNVPLTYAYCIGMVGLFGFTNFLISLKNKQNFILPLLVTITTVGAIIASSTRGAWIALFVAVMMMTALYNKRKAFIAFGIFILVACSLMMVPTFKARFKSIANTGNYFSNDARIELWHANWEMFKDNPILGVGAERGRNHLPEYYKKINSKYNFIGHAHNDFFNTLSGMGLPGTIAWIWFCGYFIILAYKLFRKSTDPKLQLLTLGGLGAQIYMTVGGFTQCNFYDNEVTHILIFIWALLVGIQSYMNRSGKPASFLDP